MTGEGTYIDALASISQEKITVVLVNYDEQNANTELVPVMLTNLNPGTYTLTLHYLEGNSVTIPNIKAADGLLKRTILMKQNTVIAFELMKE